MNIGNSLNLKDYKIIKIILSDKNPENHLSEIGQSFNEVQKRKAKIKHFLGEWLNL